MSRYAAQRALCEERKLINNLIKASSREKVCSRVLVGGDPSCMDSMSWRAAQRFARVHFYVMVRCTERNFSEGFQRVALG